MENHKRFVAIVQNMRGNKISISTKLHSLSLSLFLRVDMARYRQCRSKYYVLLLIKYINTVICPLQMEFIISYIIYNIEKTNMNIPIYIGWKGKVKREGLVPIKYNGQWLYTEAGLVMRKQTWILLFFSAWDSYTMYFNLKGTMKNFIKEIMTASPTLK